MQINVTFNDTQEMEQFCRLVAGAKEVKAEAPARSGPSVPAAPAPAQAPTTQAPVAPAAPVTQNPVAPTAQAPVVPAAPVAQAPVAPAAPVAGTPAVQAPAAPAAQAPAGQPAVPTGTVPTKEPGYTLDDLSRAAITLLDAGHQQAELQQLLAQFGVAALPALPQEQYGAFATALRGLGAKI